MTGKLADGAARFCRFNVEDRCFDPVLLVHVLVDPRHRVPSAPGRQLVGLQGEVRTAHVDDVLFHPDPSLGFTCR
ncbi:hypothetical protein D3C73_1589670 [compost metagenome]